MSNYEIPRPSENSHTGMHHIGGISVEIFWADRGFAFGSRFPEPGWYWWACQPGCLPEGDPQGPFATSQDAHEDAFASYAEEATGS